MHSWAVLVFVWMVSAVTMNSWLNQSVNSLARTVHTVRDAWRFAMRPPAGRIITPDPHVDLLDFITDGLKLSQLRSRINSALGGELGEGRKLFAEMERKDTRLKSVAATRRMALTNLEWEVVSAAEVQEKIEDAQLAEEAAARIRESFGNLECFDEALEHLATGIGPNLAVLETVWEGMSLVDLSEVDGARLRMEPPEPGVVRIITRNDRKGIVAELPKFVVHMPHGRDLYPFRKSLSAPQSLIWLTKALAFADWKMFCTIFGMPTRIGTYRPGATTDEKKEMADMLANMGSKAWGAFSEGVNLQLVESSQRGTSPHKDFIEFCSRETSILWLGGHLTTDTTGGTGTLAAASVHNEVREDIRNDDIRRESRTIRRQIIAPMIAFAFPGKQVPLPHFRRIKPEVVDRVQEAQLMAAAQTIGVSVTKKHAHDRLGIPEPEPKDEILTPSLDAFGEGLNEGVS